MKKPAQKRYCWSSLVLKNLESSGPLRGTFSGYASTYSVDRSQDLISPGAFTKTLAEWKKRKNRYPHLYWEHDFEEIIGICEELREDDYGLHLKGKLLMDIPKAHEAYERLRQGINGLSIGFFPLRTTVKNNVRHITDLTLKEISLVDSPCNREAEIYEFKSDNDLLNALADLKETITS